MRLTFIFILSGFLFWMACTSGKDQKKQAAEDKPAKVVTVPAFNADSAYSFIEKQVGFGPRIPNSPAHRKAGDYFISQFKKYGAQVIVQEFQATTYDKQKLTLRNIIASFYPEKTKRVLLAAHWDTRPWADKDPEKPKGYFDGANDGGSGVGVLLEIARTLSQSTPPDVGVDIILFDGEDWGYDNATADALYGKATNFPLPNDLHSWWCLGSQYWAKNKHKPNYSAYFGILLDMVGGKNSVFVREGNSMDYAPGIVHKVWSTASRIGYGHVFLNKNDGAITDDHIFVNELAKIPMIDIISYDQQFGHFGDFHHTRKDNMDVISKETLKAVGATVMSVVYYE